MTTGGSFSGGATIAGTPADHLKGSGPLQRYGVRALVFGTAGDCREGMGV